MPAGPVSVSYLNIVIHHLKTAVAEKSLQAERIAPIDQIPVCKGMSKPVGMNFEHASPISELGQHLPQCIVCKFPALGSKQRTLWVERFAICEILP